MTTSPTTKLTERVYWDDVHEHEGADLARAKRKSAWKQFTSSLKRALGPRIVDAARNYDDFLLWEVILPKFLAGRAGARAVEIGSAPGEFMVRLRDRFDVVPYGIEYSPVGVALNRETFAAAGIDPAQVIEGDFFAPALHESYRHAFDIVCSRGFIEHFSDPGDVIARHLNLLKPGGLLIVSIPNLRGLNRLLAWGFDRDVLAMHNLSIMTRRRLGEIHALPALEPLWCDYFGTFNLRLFNARPGVGRTLLGLSSRCQPALNVAFRTAFGAHSLETPWSSPNLMYVGRKTSDR